MRSLCSFALLLSIAGVLPAQSNTVVGLDGRLTRVDNLTYYGRRGAPHPNGEVGMAMLNTMCNPGTVEIPWFAAMQPDHPKFGFIITRESNGRMVQINDWRSYCKHAFTSVNVSGACGTCQGSSAGGARMGIHCSDTYGAGNNADRYWLGPPEEIDPWLGVWNPRGSYFDAGDPNVGFPANQDGVRSLTRSQVRNMDPVKNRVTVKEQDLLVPGARYFYGIQLIHQGEASANRHDNRASRGFTPVWTGSSWSFNNNSVGMAYGSILQHWQGASVDSAQNGNDDGTFFVAVKVTGPVNNVWHYEYAIHNFDNSRGGASLRIPVCSSATISNVGFRDINDNPLDDWTFVRQNGELQFQAPAGNPLNWNQIFNFWFDSSVPPIAGQVEIDEARMGPGALFVSINSQVPGGVSQLVDLGPGCGTPAPALSALGQPSIPNANFQLMVSGVPNSGVFLFNSLATANVNLGGGCTQYLDGQLLTTHGFFSTGITGLALIPLPIPNNPTLQGLELSWQAAQLASGGALFGQFNLTNGLLIRLGTNLTCP